jgi:uncharacterized protein YbjT (DUF2867 family)
MSGSAPMSEFTVLVVGATGSIGRHVVAQSLRCGYRTRALVRDEKQTGHVVSRCGNCRW